MAIELGAGHVVDRQIGAEIIRHLITDTTAHKERPLQIAVKRVAAEGWRAAAASRAIIDGRVVGILELGLE